MRQHGEKLKGPKSRNQCLNGSIFRMPTHNQLDDSAFGNLGMASQGATCNALDLSVRKLCLGISQQRDRAQQRDRVDEGVVVHWTLLMAKS